MAIGISPTSGFAKLPGMRMFDEWRSTQHEATWPEPPDGDGRPVTLIPGFLAGDPSLTRMAKWLRSGEYELVRSGIRWNVDCMEKTVSAVERRLEIAVEADGRRALVVGQSRGGAIGKVLAIRRPDLVETLVTLGSPLRNQTDVHPRVWPSIGLVGGLGTVGVPGLLSRECMNGDCCRQARTEFYRRFPEDVRFISFYSRSDTVVKYEACLDRAAEHIEIDSSHLGMGVDVRLWRILAAELDQSRG
ncbi:MAG: alpha/beta hydrolase [Thermoleophilia bacterium]|nr:alpha/beta hydrolase [Thermoleophilia bacterium]